MLLAEGMSAWRAHASQFADRGIILPQVKGYLPEEWKRDYRLAFDSAMTIEGAPYAPAFALDAQPQLSTVPNSGVPFFLTTLIDPQVYRILFAANKAAKIAGEVRKGTWVDTTTMFPQVEHDGEVSSYGDFNENGHTGANMNWPQRQAYLYQTVKEYGDLELERAGLGRINWVQELDGAAMLAMDKFQNLSYFYGIAGLENYGLLNDPNLSAPISPGPKAWGGTTWFSSGILKATANEIYTDIVSVYYQLVNQSNGLIQKDDDMTLAMSPDSAVGLTATNSFNVNVEDLLKKNFPNMKVETAVQYGVNSPTNSQGYVGGNYMQLIAHRVEGQDTCFCAYNEKFRAHNIIKAMSSFKQKMTGGTWGTVIRMPFAIAAMLGI